MLNSESNLQNQIFCKFKGLDKNTQENNICELNSRFCEILRDCRLYGASFEKLNDRDEGRFFVSTSQTKLIKETRGNKKQFKICCFALEEAKLDKDLMWAHYGNGHCGVKIDFRVDEKYKVFKMRYGEEIPQYDEQDSEFFIKEILTNKKQCFAYENEYRAIWKEGDNYLPIQICAITLGKRFTEEEYYNDEKENREFAKNDNVVRIARQFLEIWKQGVHNRGGEKPEFYACKTKYSPKPKPIPFDILEKVRL